jgi:hypothetical protein
MFFFRYTPIDSHELVEARIPRTVGGGGRLYSPIATRTNTITFSFRHEIRIPHKVCLS